MFDVVGERRSGGTDLVVSCAAPLDNSAETLNRLETKIRNYLTEATSPDFASTYPSAAHGPIRIFVHCEYGVSDEARALVTRLAETAKQSQIELTVGDPLG